MPEYRDPGPVRPQAVDGRADRGHIGVAGGEGQVDDVVDDTPTVQAGPEPVPAPSAVKGSMD